MPGKVIDVLVGEGQAVGAGDPLVLLEAMKMEHAVKAPGDGVVTRVAVSAGEQVDGDTLLVVVTPPEP
jgi:biotin carboxyl carrier protein